MSNTKTLKSLSLEIHSLLSLYILIHEEIFNESGSLSSLFRKVDFEKFHDQTKSLLLEFKSRQIQVEKFGKGIYEQLSDEQKEYFDCLLTYFNKLTHTVKLLCDRQYKLYSKSEGQKYSLWEYLKMERLYKSSIREYLQYGKKLNSLKQVYTNMIE